MFSDQSEFENDSTLNLDKAVLQSRKEVEPTKQVIKQLEKIRLLKHFSFGNRLRDGVAVNNVILSPQFLTPTILQPLFGVVSLM